MAGGLINLLSTVFYQRVETDMFFFKKKKLLFTNILNNMFSFRNWCFCVQNVSASLTEQISIDKQNAFNG